MSPLPVTAATSAVLGLIFAVLTVQVVRARGAAGASLGDGSSGLIAPGQEPTVPLLVATRSHANFAEYVPLALILLGFVEWGGAARWFVCLLATALIASRLLHPIGMGRKIPNPFRAAGAALTLLTIVVSCLSLLIGLLR
jgi:uncharacterized membrane protein YecN with MAPEG domain